LRALGERGAAIKRMHRSPAGRTELKEEGGGYVLAAEQTEAPVLGRLLERRHDDELRGLAYAIVTCNYRRIDA
jgi:type IV secretory pathway VirD2 relaxase